MLKSVNLKIEKKRKKKNGFRQSHQLNQWYDEGTFSYFCEKIQPINVWEVKKTHGTADSGHTAHRGLQIGPASLLAPCLSACTSECKCEPPLDIRWDWRLLYCCKLSLILLLLLQLFIYLFYWTSVWYGQKKVYFKMWGVWCILQKSDISTKEKEKQNNTTIFRFIDLI